MRQQSPYRGDPTEHARILGRSSASNMIHCLGVVLCLYFVLRGTPSWGAEPSQAQSNSNQSTIPRPSSTTFGASPLTKILGVSPQVFEPGAPVRIFLSSPVFETPQQATQQFSVQIGGRAAKILESSSPDSITVQAPMNLPVGKPLTIQILGQGLNLDSGLDLPIFAESSNLFRFLRNGGQDSILSSLLIVGTTIPFLGLLTLGYIWFRNRKHERALVSEVERLQFSLDRRVKASTATDSAKLEAGADRDPTIASERTSPPPAIPNGLIDSISRGECTLFWGAGLSAQAGYLTWHQALAEIIERTASEPTDSPRAELQNVFDAGRISLVVDLLATRLGREPLINELTRIWGSPRDSTPATVALSKLPFTNVVTSVWDPLVELTFRHRLPAVVTGVSNDNLEPLLSREAFCIVRLWGSLMRPESLLFTSNEYRAAVAGNPTYAKYLASLALSQTHLFIGASLGTIEEYLAATPSSQASRIHYALVPEDDETTLVREVLQARYGVELIVIRPTPGWPEVRAFIESLSGAVTEHARKTPADAIEPFQLKSVKLENIGPFRSLALDLDDKWNVMLGNNGSGKSTLLRAIALVLCGDDPRALAEGGRLLRSGTHNGSVEVVVGRETYRTELSRDTSRRLVHVNAGLRVAPLKIGRWVALAFPPLRGVSTENPKGPTTDGSRSPDVEDVIPILLGSTDTRLNSLKQWLVNLHLRSSAGEGVTEQQAKTNLELRDKYFEIFNTFVPGANVKFAGVDRDSWQVNVTTNGVEVGIDQVSQGMSSILGWVGALLQRMYEIHGPSLDLTRDGAVVLIDEIDAHLHPEWQQRIIGTLREQFPNVQFIATTHSPLIVGELDPSQVYRIQWLGEMVVAEHPTQPIQGMGVAGLLTSEMFGLTSTVDETTQKLLETQRELSSSDKPLTDDEKVRLDQVNKDLEPLGFHFEMRDQEFKKYLKMRYPQIQDEIESDQQSRERRAPVNPRVTELIKSAISRVNRPTEKGDS
jgi:energy-coupling factor transporter ATP-binding protein EcfA2